MKKGEQKAHKPCSGGLVWNEASPRCESGKNPLCRWVLWAAGHADIRDYEIMTLCQSMACALVLLLLVFPLRALFVPYFQHDKHTCNENAWLNPHRGAPNYRRDPEVVMTVLHECKVLLSKRAPREPLILPSLVFVHLHILGSSCPWWACFQRASWLLQCSG